MTENYFPTLETETSQQSNFDKQWESIILPDAPIFEPSKTKKIIDTIVWQLVNGLIVSSLAVITTQIDVIQSQLETLINDNAYYITIVIIVLFMLYNALNITTKTLNDKKLSPLEFLKDLIRKN